MSAPTLRPYQVDALEATVQGWNQGANRLLVKMPTGTGKTVMFAAMLSWPGLKARLDALPAGRGAKMLIIAHREELLDQAAAKLRAQHPGMIVDIEQGSRHASPYCDVVVASIQTLSAMRFRRLLRLTQRHTFRLVVVDEAHHAAASSYRTALVHLGFLPPADVSESGDTEAANFDDVAVMTRALEGWDLHAPKDRLLVGVTATPNRSDAIGLGCVFQSIAYSYGLKQAIEDRYLVPIKPWVIETADSLDDVHTTAGDFNQKELAETVNNPTRNRLAVASWQLYAGDRSTIAFTVDVAHAHDLADTFLERGIVARAVSGKTPKEERRQILADFTAGRVQVITNCMVLTEGTDLPLTGCILHAKPTKSATLYEQMTGRGLRIHPGKTDCIVIDLVDIARRHTLQAAPVLYGLPPGLKTNGDDLRKTADDLDALAGKYAQFDIDAALQAKHFTVQELLDRASTFDVWTLPTMGDAGEGLSCNWIRSGADIFKLQYPWQDGTETLQVTKDLLGHFDVSLTLRPQGKPGEPWPTPRQRTLATQVASANEALRFAEQFVHAERRTVLKLKDRDAPWRQRPASPKQLALLSRLRVPHNAKTLTMGGASDLIDLAQARRGR